MARTGSPKPAAEQKKLPGIFLSYRRTDNPDATGRIYDRLVTEFGKKRVFKDVDSIPLGQDFRGHLNEVVGGCSAVLCIIGPRWTDARNSAGTRRLEDADDFVRIELEAALARNIPVVPVLVGHATMPVTADLPPSLESMVYRQSIEVRPDPDFHHDSTRLVEALKRILDPDAPEEEPVVPVSMARTARMPATRSGRPLAWSIAAATGLAAAALAIPAWIHLRETPPPEMRTDIVTPASSAPESFALSPDGRQIVYAVGKGSDSQLWLRSLTAGTERPLPGTEGGTDPFWSPDGRAIAFFTESALKRLYLDGSQPRQLGVVALGGAGGSWSKDDVILYGYGSRGPILRVDVDGGSTSVVIKPTAERDSLQRPVFLPDGQQFMFGSTGTEGGMNLGSLDDRPPVKLLAGNVYAYLPSGWLLLNQGNAIVARQLDLKKAKLGKPVMVADGAFNGLSTSATGLIALRKGVPRPRQLRWVDRSGTPTGTIGDPDVQLTSPRIEPDGSRVAVGLRGNLVVLEGARRLQFATQTSDNNPVWSPEGKWLAFTSWRSGGGDLYMRLADGTGPEELLVSSGQLKVPSSWSPDGRFLMYVTGVGAKADTDLWIQPMTGTGDRNPYPFLNTPANERPGEFSPKDGGRWIAYQSDATGDQEIYLRPFVASGTATNSELKVSTAGGGFPVWRADGKELYYINPAGEMMAVTVTIAGDIPVLGKPERLFQTGLSTNLTSRRPYDVASDGRFLILSELDAGTLPPITLIQNWKPEAKQ